MIHVYCGDGKGKTTAAIGISIRAAGAGKQVVFAQFMKGRDTSELAILHQLDNIEVLRNAKDYGFLFQMSPEDKEAVRKMHEDTLSKVIERVEEGQAQLVVLDEITYPYNEGLIDCERLEQFIKGLGSEVELVLTGRNPAPFFWEQADYITEMDCIRHPYQKGQEARIGIEY